MLGRLVTAVSLAVALPLSGTVSPSGQPVAAQVTPVTTQPRADCQPLPDDSILYLDGNGNVFPTARADLAEAHVTDGGTIVIPPVGWQPTTATDAELQTYNFPPRQRATQIWLGGIKFLPTTSARRCLIFA
jgi:hypothetical protein